MKFAYSIVRSDRFIEATRDSGYKSTDSALSELIDNSIQAHATSVKVEFIAPPAKTDGPGRPKIPRVKQVLIADNGRGMDAETLRRALRFGDSSRFGDRSGMGRFGMGLPNASVSQARRVEVYSWVRGCKPLHTYIDVDEIVRGELVEVPEPREVDIPAPYTHLCQAPSGTLVVWKSCDRLDHGGKLDTLVRSLRPTLGRKFRYFLIGDFDLRIDGIEVAPLDPMYLMSQARLKGDELATKHGDTLSFDVPVPGKIGQTSTVEVNISLLPERWQIEYGPGKTKDQKSGMRARHIETTAGYSIVRANREIDLISSPYHARHWKDRWYRVEVRFDPELDELFGVTHTKQHARISRGSAVFNQMESAIKANINTLLQVIEHRKPKRITSGPLPAEEMAKQVEPMLKPIESLSDKHPDDKGREVADFVQDRIAAGTSPEVVESLNRRLSEYPVIIELEHLPGAPIYRSKTVGDAIVVMLNTSHTFYDRVYRRLEDQSPTGKIGIDLLLMALGRSEEGASDEAREWYDSQRQEWSQNLKRFTGQIPEFEESDED